MLLSGRPISHISSISIVLFSLISLSKGDKLNAIIGRRISHISNISIVLISLISLSKGDKLNAIIEQSDQSHSYHS